MNYNLKTLPPFEKEAKRLSKKYASFKNDILELSKKLIENPIQGDNLGKNFYKVRFAISSKGKGKSGGARLITYIKVVETTIYLATLYDKSNKSSISEKELEKLLLELEIIG
jgi:mRNA-degrading endonuclease RelE of RelBE toxin-antitoxin system